MLVVIKDLTVEDHEGKIFTLDNANWRKAVNVECASEIYTDGDTVVIHTQARNHFRKFSRKETGMEIEHCKEVYHKTAVEIFDEIIFALQDGQKVYVL